MEGVAVGVPNAGTDAVPNALGALAAGAALGNANALPANIGAGCNPNAAGLAAAAPKAVPKAGLAAEAAMPAVPKLKPAPKAGIDVAAPKHRAGSICR